MAARPQTPEQKWREYIGGLMDIVSSQQMYDEIMEVSNRICWTWEIDFLESIRPRLEHTGQISDRQRDVLERIYDKACRSPY